MYLTVILSQFLVLRMLQHLKYVYLFILLQNAFAFEVAWRKAVVHKDRITTDDHYASASGTLTEIDRIQLPQGQKNGVNYYNISIIRH